MTGKRWQMTPFSCFSQKALLSTLTFTIDTLLCWFTFYFFHQIIIKNWKTNRKTNKYELKTCKPTTRPWQVIQQVTTSQWYCFFLCVWMRELLLFFYHLMKGNEENTFSKSIIFLLDKAEGPTIICEFDSKWHNRQVIIEYQ